MTNNDLGRVATFDFSFAKDTLYSLELGKELNPCNPFRHFLQPVVSSIDVRANVTVLDCADKSVVELNPYFALNWYQFPWCQRIRTIVSFGEGFSYVSSVPLSESKYSDKAKNLLNFLLFEVGFALPSLPQFEALIRIHHRSGVFGLYSANNSGSTAIGLALRYRF